MAKIIFVMGMIGMSFSAAMADESWTPNAQQIAHVEKILVLPSGTHPLAGYARYYWGITIKGTRLVRGALVFGGKMGIHLTAGPVRESKTDQGCNLIYVSYDPSTDRATASCDGLA